MEKLILNEAKRIEDKLISIRRQIHKNPELSLKEFKTSELIYKTLKEEGLEVEKGFYETAVMTTIKGKVPGKTVLLRADMDALPVFEETKEEYTSKNRGVMHACGHDAHITWLIGATLILNKLKEHINGTVKIIFQPAEEASGGAKELLEKRNILKEFPKVDYILAGHVWPEIEAGKIGIVNGCAMAATSFFEMKIKGKGGHASSPHKTIDPIAIGNLVYTAIQNIISRLKNPVDQGVITIGTFKGEGSFNIIPNNVIMEGTIRGESEKDIRDYARKIENILKGVCYSFDADYDFEVVRIAPEVVNNEKLVNIGIKSYQDLFGDNSALRLNKGSMTGEDFSYYLKEVPGLFVYVGSKDIEKEANYPLHSSKFNIDESIISSASAYFSKLTIDVLNI